MHVICMFGIIIIRTELTSGQRVLISFTCLLDVRSYCNRRGHNDIRVECFHCERLTLLDYYEYNSTTIYLNARTHYGFRVFKLQIRFCRLSDYGEANKILKTYTASGVT